MIFLGDFSFVKIFLTKLSCYHDNYFKYFMFGKYNGFVSKARGVCMHVSSSTLYVLPRIGIETESSGKPSAVVIFLLSSTSLGPR